MVMVTITNDDVNDVGDVSFPDSESSFFPGGPENSYADRVGSGLTAEVGGGASGH